MELRLNQIQALYTEFAALLTGAKLQQIRQHGKTSFSFEFYRQQRHQLFIHLRPHAVCFLAEHLPESVAPSSLTMALRQLIGSRLTDLRQIASDRVLIWQLQGETSHRLVLELSGRHANLFLTDDQGKLLQQLHPDNSARSLRRGMPYLPPDPRPAPANSDPRRLTELPADGSRSRAVEQAYAQDLHRLARAALLGAALKAVQAKLDRARREKARLDADLARLDEASAYQRRGELLQSAYGQVAKGQTEVTVPDYFQPDAPPVRIALDPAKDLAANIQRCFQLSRKRERAAERALELIDRVDEQIAALATQLENLTTVSVSGRELTEAEKQELAGMIPSPAAPKPALARRSPAREFFSASGDRILVGRNARENDALTFGARGNDLWLHVRDWPGSHVIVPLAKGQSVDPRTLLDAATLALHYSDAGARGEAEVTYTLRKHVSRVKGGKPGQVQLASFKTLHLRLEPQRLERLISGEDVL